jgi:hypothetical protein
MAELASGTRAHTPPRLTLSVVRPLFCNEYVQAAHQVTFVTPSTCDVLHSQSV